MKLKILLSIAFYTFVSTCFSQTLKGVYTLQSLKGIGDSSELTERAKKPMYYSYIYSKNISLQELIDGGGTTVDTVYNEYKEAPGEKFASENITIRPNRAFTYKDLTTSNFKIFFDQNKVETYISDDLPKYDWNLTNENKIISGYKCKKATTKKKILNRTQNITAWYCEEITIADGPRDFSGLPGFIIQIEIDDLTVIKFEKLKFLSRETTEILLPEIAIKPITIKEYETKN